MHSIKKWSRRTFLSTSSFVSASALIPSFSHGNATTHRDFPVQSYLACTASHESGDDSLFTIRAYAVENNNLRYLASIARVDNVSGIAIHPRHKVVYVAHDTTNYLKLPRASVSSFGLDEVSGEFVQLSREPLTLSATHPQQLAISPDGRVLLVAATGGGAYNTLSISSDGHILPHPRAIKLTRCGPHPLQSSAQPIFVRFSRSGHAAYGCDLGGDRVDYLRFVQNIPSIESSLILAPGTGPRHLAIHPSQRVLAVIGGLLPTLTLVEIDALSEAFRGIAQQVTLPAVALEASYFGFSGHNLSVIGRTQKGERVLFTFQVNPASLTVEQTRAKTISDARDSYGERSCYASGFPISDDYSLVATNVPFPYSPIVTSPENVSPEHFPVKL